MNKENAIIREVRAVRRKIAELCDNDLKKITDYANRVYEQHRRQTYAALAR